MSPAFLQLLNCSLIETLSSSSEDANEQRVIETRRKGLRDISGGMYLKVCANIAALVDHELSILGTHPPVCTPPLEPVAINPLRFLLLRILREFHRNFNFFNNEDPWEIIGLLPTNPEYVPSTYCARALLGFRAHIKYQKGCYLVD
jgi:hypothetical protein